jgi:cell division protein FtsB
MHSFDTYERPKFLRNIIHSLGGRRISQEKKEFKIIPVAIMLLIFGIVGGIGSIIVRQIGALQTRIRGFEAQVTTLQADKAQLQSRVSSLNDDKTQLQSISRYLVMSWAFLSRSW